MKLLNTREAAHLIGLESVTLERRRSCGQPPNYIKPKGRVFYSYSDLCDFVDQLFGRNPKYQPPDRECDKLLTASEVIRKLKDANIAQDAILDEIFPLPIVLGQSGQGSRKRWSLHEVTRWIDNHKSTI